ncbi:hypothetical protein BFT35_10590 [Thermoanaerobacterium thermosaccharolyticum]|uniref:radical SAM/SPASM domain-containing protein n=1 Tax=Thermoanaerobacterium thermosaccharolyticum TaxID=1517 RepID=UPI000C06F1D2|nr:radical SAM protein [Thermoanaerobacterium thermosaccharolyticum]PHO06610.1 hypothetical protein BFT35_10590 [Thermoanaerobacterium thermosaccharolyticum]
MYVRKKEKICTVFGQDAVAIYDFNVGRLYRVGLEAKNFFKKLQGGKTINTEKLDNETLQMINDCLDIGILESSEELFQDNKSFNDNIETFIDKDFKIKFCWLEITSYCNQKCLHCFMGDELNRDILDINSIKCIVKDLSEMGVEKVALTGGEPTLHPNFLEIINILGNYNIKIVVLTNGTYITDDIVEVFKKFNVMVRIPLLGLEQTHDKITGTNGSFKKCISSINRLVDNNIKLNITTTVMAINKNEIEYIQDIADELDLDFEKGPIFPIGEAKNNWEILCTKDYQDIISSCHDVDTIVDRSMAESNKYIKIPLKIKKYIDCGTRNIAITSSGKYVPCLLLRNSDFIMGDIYRKSIKYLASEENCDFVNLQDKMSVKNIKVCRNCEVRHICKGGGCRAVSYLFNNNLAEKNPHYTNCYY